MCDNDLISCHLTGDIYATTDEERVNKCLRFACHSLDCKFALFTNIAKIQNFRSENSILTDFGKRGKPGKVIESYCNSISLAKKFWISTGFLHIPLLFLRLTLRDRYHRGDARLTVVLLTAQFRTHQHASTPEAKSPHIWRAGERGDLGFAGAIQGIGKNPRVLFVHPTQACIMKCKLK